jgi:hypothetical protein
LASIVVEWEAEEAAKRKVRGRRRQSLLKDLAEREAEVAAKRKARRRRRQSLSNESEEEGSDDSSVWQKLDDWKSRAWETLKFWKR